ncbi:MAG TPA: M1 family aminopeptidase [Candidatus Acidoferrales bacterium]|nr:M1 family aminopeptidase [Candidatus Acidoferrales bacterium]
MLPSAVYAQSSAHVFGDPAVWHWAPNRAYHVENYKLGLHFDQAKGEVFGNEVVTLRPFEAHFQKFYLNSSRLTIDAVSLLPAQGAAVKLAFTAEDPKLWITLDREYGAATSLRVRIIYHGFPRTGLFFVNPTKDYPQWPREIYSQGEAEFNHYWFPCWDYPNDMATSETVTTVPDGQSVVSNGRLVRVTRAAGEATYDWVESVPHSSYLISIAVGPWRKVSDKYENKPVDYYVADSVDEATARRSFHLTPDMIGFFSRATGVDYPYEQYAQTEVHNFIFGGQENVSATTLKDSTLHDARADADYPSTDLVSHELGQHWFGDYVQGRDWADIWLNEGFATYMEALYTQHHEGYDAYRFAVYQDQMMEQAEGRQSYSRPIVDPHYSDPMDMFDTTTHEKGAAVLDMLRYVVDWREAAAKEASQNEELFRALNHYLTARRTQAANTADLEEAIRESTGLELGWFFHEWVYCAGHPEYRVTANYDAAAKMELVRVEQTQHADETTPIFDMPIELAIYGDGGARKKIVQVRDYLQEQEFDVPVDFVPEWVDFDPDDFIDKTLTFEQPVEALIAEAETDPSMMSRLWAVQELGAMKDADAETRVDALERVLDADEFYAVRAAAAASLGEIGGEKAKSALIGALKQPDSRVRSAVTEALAAFAKDSDVYDAFVNALHHDESYAVEAAAAEGIGKSGNAGAFEVLQAEAATKPELHVMQGTLAGLAMTKDPRAVAILLANARPGLDERVRLGALAGLAQMKDEVERDHADELAEVVRGALEDPYLPMRMAGEQLTGAFELTQFRAEIQKDVDAPLVFQRDAAKSALEKLGKAVDKSGQ